jgi:hypothetical protein
MSIYSRGVLRWLSRRGGSNPFFGGSLGRPVGILAVVGHRCHVVHLCCPASPGSRLGGTSICCRFWATRGSCPVSGRRCVDRLFGCETVRDHAEEKCRDQDRCGECKHSDGIHWRFPRVEIIVGSHAIYSLPVECVFPRGCANISGEMRVGRRRQRARQHCPNSRFRCAGQPV